MTPTPSIQLTVPDNWNAERHARYSRVFNRPWYHRLHPGFVMACIIALAICIVAFIGAAQAGTPAPYGYSVWCAEDERNCPEVDPVTLEYSDDLYFMLREWQREVRFAIRYAPDKGGDFWRYPDRGMGDCEDIAIWLRGELIRVGIPRGAIRFASGPDQYGRNHAWLEVMTDRGPYAVDAYEVEPRARFHARAVGLETYDCQPGYGCEWRSNVLYPTERVVAHTQDRTAP